MDNLVLGKRELCKDAICRDAKNRDAKNRVSTFEPYLSLSLSLRESSYIPIIIDIHPFRSRHRR